VLALIARTKCVIGGQNRLHIAAREMNGADIAGRHIAEIIGECDRDALRRARSHCLSQAAENQKFGAAVDTDVLTLAFKAPVTVSLTASDWVPVVLKVTWKVCLP